MDSVCNKTHYLILLTLIIFFKINVFAYSDVDLPQSQIWRIGIIRTQPLYAEEIEDGLKSGLKQLGYIDGEDIDFLPTQVVDGKIENFPDTAIRVRDYMDQSPDIIATIGTQASIPSWLIIKQTLIPMVFAGVTYPIEGKLIENFNSPTGENITGISYAPSVYSFFKELRDMFQDQRKYKTIAFVYSGRILQDYLYMRTLKLAGVISGWDFIFLDFFDYVQEKEDIWLLISGLKNVNADFVFGFYGFHHLTSEERVLKKIIQEIPQPVLSLSSNMTDYGAIGGIVVNNFNLGCDQAKIIDKIIKGKIVSEIPPIEPERFDIEINLRKAREYGIEFDIEIIRKAARVVY